MIQKHWLKIAVVLASLLAGFVAGYFTWGYRAPVDTTPIEWVISDKTRGETATKIKGYERRIDELEREKT